MAASWLVLAGCVQPTSAVRGPQRWIRAESGPTRVETTADWNDVVPAINVALGQTDLVKITINRPNADRIEVPLRSARDEPGLLVVERQPGTGPGPGEAVPMVLTCSIGRFGDPANESFLLRRVVRRLEELKGVDFAPIGG